MNECKCQMRSAMRSAYVIKDGRAVKEPSARVRPLSKYGWTHSRINALMFRIQELEAEVFGKEQNNDH